MSQHVVCALITGQIVKEPEFILVNDITKCVSLNQFRMIKCTTNELIN